MEPIKKPYKPKADKVQKLHKYHAKLKQATPKSCALFKNVAKVIFLTAFFSSCSAQWHVKRAIKKDPTILNRDTIFADTVIVTRESIKTDTMVLRDHDTIEIASERFKTRVIRFRDTFVVTTTIKPDTIKVRVAVPVERIIYKKRAWVGKWVGLLAFLTMVILAIITIRKR